MAVTTMNAIDTSPDPATTTALGRPSRTSARRSPGVVTSVEDVR